MHFGVLGNAVASDAVVAVCKHCGLISMQLALTEVEQVVPAHCAASLVPKSRKALQAPSQVHAEQLAGDAFGASPASNAVSENPPVQWMASAPVRNAIGPCQPLGAASTQRIS